MTIMTSQLGKNTMERKGIPRLPTSVAKLNIPQLKLSIKLIAASACVSSTQN